MVFGEFCSPIVPEFWTCCARAGIPVEFLSDQCFRLTGVRVPFQRYAAGGEPVLLRDANR